MNIRNARLQIVMVAGLCLGMTASASAQTKPASGNASGKVGHLLNESGEVKIPLTASISAADINKLLTAVTDPALATKDAIVSEVKAKLTAYMASIKDNDPNDYQFIKDHYNYYVDQLTTKALAFLQSKSDALNASVAKANTDAANAIKSGLDKVVTASGLTIDVFDTYRYLEGERDQGSPGWTDPPQTSPGDTSGISGGGTIGWLVHAGVAAVGEATVDIHMEVSIDVEAELKCKFVNLGNIDKPDTLVRVEPTIDFKVTAEVIGEGGGKVGVKMGLTKSIDLPWAPAKDAPPNLHADGEPK
jgi:hypothetical protein